MGYAQKIGGGKYVVSTNDTTSIVSNRGSKDPKNEFLFRKKGPEADSIYDAIRSKYANLENAILDVDGLITEIENDRDLLKMGNTSLAYRLSRANIESREKETRARVIADSLQQEMVKKSAEELAQRYARYGDKPSYFVNGIQVQSELISQFTQGDIVTRNMKIQEDGIGNPNGEIWITVTDKAARKYNLPGLDGNIVRDASTPEYTPTPTPSVNTTPYYESDVRKDNVQPQPATNETKTTIPKVENKKKKEKAPKRSVRWIKSDRESRNEDTPKASAPAYQPAPVPAPPAQSQARPVEQKRVEPQPQQQKAATQSQVQPQQVQQTQQAASEQKVETTAKSVENNTQSPVGSRKTIVRARTVNNEEVNTNEPVDSVGGQD